MAKKKAKKKATSKKKQPKLETSEEGLGRLPEDELYKLMFFESAVESAKNKLSEQRVAFDLWRLEQSRKQESMKHAIQGFANTLRDAEVRYNSFLAELANKYGITWSKVGLRQDGTIMMLPEAEEEAEEKVEGDGEEATKQETQATKDGG